MTVYDKENPKYFDRALQSILVDQTVLPDQFVLVYDGPINSKLNEVTEKYQRLFINEFVLLKLNKNVGQGAASKAGFERCRYELISRMDSDDISYPNRFEKELEIFFSHSNIDVVGGFITEFKTSENDIIGKRIVKEKHEEIVKDFHKRNPINNVTVMFKKQAMIDIGGYSDERVNEDFNIYVRFLLSEKRFYNLQMPLVNVRVGDNMIERRGDIGIYKAWKKNQKLLYDGKVINWFEYKRNCIK